MEISRLGLIAHPEAKKGLLQKLTKRIRGKKTRIFFDPVAAKILGEKPTPIQDLDVEVAIVFGGDGTLLWATRNVRCDPLFLGIKTGRVGFMIELDEKTMLAGVDKLFKGEYWVDERAKIVVNNKYEGLNEAVILPEKPGKLLEFRIRFNGREISQFRADGIIVSTPTGSTAHALSAGGPVIYPESDVYAIVPIVPFMHHQPPMIVPDDSEIIIETISTKSDICLVIDGNMVKKIKQTEEVKFKKSANITKFARFGEKRWKHIINKNF
jgi:NAD+ kinase